METKIYKAKVEDGDRDEIRKVILSAQMADIKPLSVYGKPYIVRISYYRESQKKETEFIVISNCEGSVIETFIEYNSKHCLVIPYAISKIEVFDVDILVDITKRIGM